MKGLIMKGYCWLHDLNYKLIEPDSVCPQCLKTCEVSLRQRDNNDRLTWDELDG